MSESLFQIDEAIQRHFEAAEEYLERGEVVPEEVQQAIVHRFGELGNKVDGICGFYHSREATIAAAKAEIARLQARRKAAEAEMERLEAMLMRFMQDRGITKLESKLSKIALQNNGGKPALVEDSTPPADVGWAEDAKANADQCRQVTVVMPASFWAQVQLIVEHGGGSVTAEGFNKDLVREKLESGEPVAGFRLERGQHVRIK